jgi:hypothetical protein
MSNYDDASLIMFPSGYKEDKIYSLKPTDGSGDLTFTRASTATRVNAEGLIEQVPYNLLQYSEEFDNAVWTKVGCSIITDSIISPNELFYSDYLKENISTSEHRLRFAGIPKSSNQVMTFSAYVKPNGRHLQMSLEYSGVGVQSIFNITNNTYTLSDSASWTRLSTEILNIGDGWYRCSISAITDANVSINARLQLASNPIGGVNQIYTGDGTSGIYIWGAQLVTGTTAKTYFPTTDRLDVPRIDYTGGGCGKLLLEPQRTNLVTYSEQFDNAAWLKGNVTITANQTTSPDGYVNADKVESNTTNTLHYFGPAVVSFVAGTTYTTSVFVKKDTGRYFQILYGSGGFTINDYANFDLQDGVVTLEGSGADATITDYSNGWYRCSITSTCSANYSDSGYGAIITTANAARVQTHSTALSYWVYGYQIEAGSYATSYIPTLASSVTRLADAAFKTGISSLIGQTEGTIFVDCESFATGTTNVLFMLADGTTNNRVEFYWTGTNSGNFICSSGGAMQFNIAFTLTQAQRNKIAVVYKVNDFAVYANGASIASYSGGSVPSSLSSLEFSEGASYLYMGKINQALLFPARLTNTQLATLTTYII